MKNPLGHSRRQGHGRSVLALFGLMLMLLAVAACSPQAPKPTGPAAVYENAKDMFGRGRFDKAVEITDNLAAQSPADAYTEKARVLRAALFSAEVNASKDAAEAYEKGADATRNPHFKAEYQRLRHDSLQVAATRAVELGETAQQITAGGGFDKDFTLDAPYPTTEGPMAVAQYEKVRQGAWIEPQDQEAAASDGELKGIDDALAAIVGGDRSKAREALGAGPVTLKGVDFALYLGNELVTGATLFDRKHNRDPLKLRALCNAADEIAKGVQAQLKASPNPDAAKKLKKLQDQIKTTLKNV
jgi:hypothetical protein